MTNVNAPAHLAEFAAEHGIDLAGYHEVLKSLRGVTSPGGKVFIDPEPPFAADVLGRLQIGTEITQALAEARQTAIDNLDAQD